MRPALVFAGALAVGIAGVLYAAYTRMVPERGLFSMYGVVVAIAGALSWFLAGRNATDERSHREMRRVMRLTLVGVGTMMLTPTLLALVPAVRRFQPGMVALVVFFVLSALFSRREG